MYRSSDSFVPFFLRVYLIWPRNNVPQNQPLKPTNPSSPYHLICRIWIFRLIFCLAQGDDTEGETENGSPAEKSSDHTSNSLESLHSGQSSPSKHLHTSDWSGKWFDIVIIIFLFLYLLAQVVWLAILMYPVTETAWNWKRKCPTRDSSAGELKYIQTLSPVHMIQTP